MLRVHINYSYPPIIRSMSRVFKMANKNLEKQLSKINLLRYDNFTNKATCRKE